MRIADIQSEHTTTLAEHTARFGKVELTLTEHTARFDSIDRTLAAILAKLP